MKLYIKRGSLEIYQGDKINYNDIECTSPRPSKYHTPIIEMGVHTGWEVTVSGQQAQQDDMLIAFKEAIQSRLDEKARTRGYDHVLSLCTYVTDPIPRFAAEGQAGVNWRGTTWATSYAIMDAVIKGERSIPTIEELLSELPPLLWPDEEITPEPEPEG